MLIFFFIDVKYTIHLNIWIYEYTYELLTFNVVTSETLKNEPRERKLVSS